MHNTATRWGAAPPPGSLLLTLTATYGAIQHESWRNATHVRVPLINPSHTPFFSTLFVPQSLGWRLTYQPDPREVAAAMYPNKVRQCKTVVVTGAVPSAAAPPPCAYPGTSKQHAASTPYSLFLGRPFHVVLVALPILVRWRPSCFRTRYGAPRAYGTYLQSVRPNTADSLLLYGVSPPPCCCALTHMHHADVALLVAPDFPCYTLPLCLDPCTPRRSGAPGRRCCPPSTASPPPRPSEDHVAWRSACTLKHRNDGTGPLTHEMTLRCVSYYC